MLLWRYTRFSYNQQLAAAKPLENMLPARPNVKTNIKVRGVICYNQRLLEPARIIEVHLFSEISILYCQKNLKTHFEGAGEGVEEVHLSSSLS